MKDLIKKKAISLALLAKRRGSDYKASYAKQHKACLTAFPDYKIIKKMSVERPHCQMLARSGPLYWAWLYAYRAQAALIVSSLDQLGNDRQSLDILRDQTDVPILIANLGQDIKDLPKEAFLHLASLQKVTAAAIKKLNRLAKGRVLEEADLVRMNQR